jgi:molecular chaperone GrpE
MSEPDTQPDDHEPASDAAEAQPLVDDTVVELTRERDALQDRLLRAAAEFDNYRKRAERERRDLADYVTGQVLADVLPLLDNFERAMQAPAGDPDALRTGIELIHKQFVDALRKRGVVAIETAGKPFDPNLHQAVAREIVDDVPDGQILEEMQRGYVLGERLLRPAMVKVATRS